MLRLGHDHETDSRVPNDHSFAEGPVLTKHISAWTRRLNSSTDHEAFHTAWIGASTGMLIRWDGAALHFAAKDGTVMTSDEAI